MPNAAAAGRMAVLLQSLEGGGSQRRIVELVNGFIEAGRNVDLVLAQAHGELRDRVSPAVRIVELGAPQQSLSAYLDRETPDALLAGAAAVHDVAVEAMSKPRRVPLVLRASSDPFRLFPWSMPRQRLREPLRRRSRIQRYAAADLIIAVADDIAATIARALPAARIKVIDNPVVTPSFLAGADAPISLPWSDELDIPLVIGVGRLALAKDFPTLLRAFALLRATRRARLVILGGGSTRERDTLLRLARKLSIEADFAMPGETEAVAAWLKRAALFVSSSLWEGSAGAFIEALAMGCPVVATSVGSARQLMRDGKLGALVRPSDPKAMANAMAVQLDTPSDPVQLRAAAAPFRADRQAAEYLAAIDECVRDFRG